VYAFGLCVDEGYLLPSLVTIASLADTLSPAARRQAAVRVLTLDLSRGHAATMADLARRAGFGSFDLVWCRPPRGSRLVDDSYITITTYLRFQFTPAFVGRPYLIYLDADVLALGDVSAPLEGLGQGRLGAVADEFNPAVGQCPALPGLADRWPVLHGRTYYNAGALWAPTVMLAAIRGGVERALAHGSEFILHNDQDALNLWLLASPVVHPVPGVFNRFEVGRFLELGDWVRRVVERPLHSTGARLLHFVGPAKPWLASCPVTQDVRLYRSHLAQTVRHIHRLGDLGIEAATTAAGPR
jgi:lipopolysaccharide biosynthesis glycosyltransferase